MPENLIEHFEDTLRRCESGALRDATRQAMEGTKVYREDFRAQQPLMPRYERRITVEDTTTFAAAARFGNQYGVAVLNFANPEVPGGGVKKRCHGAGGVPLPLQQSLSVSGQYTRRI